jgi:hypothetical protein
MILAGLFNPLASTVGVAALPASGPKTPDTPAPQIQLSIMNKRAFPLVSAPRAEIERKLNFIGWELLKS